MIQFKKKHLCSVITLIRTTLFENKIKLTNNNRYNYIQKNYLIDTY